MKQRLTNKQLEVYCFAKDYHKENDNLPSGEEIASFLGLANRASGFFHYQALVRKGYLEKMASGKYRFTRERIE
jgi:SOS-response transcriptional repressor LexA